VAQLILNLEESKMRNLHRSVAQLILNLVSRPPHTIPGGGYNHMLSVQHQQVPTSLEICHYRSPELHFSILVVRYYITVVFVLQEYHGTGTTVVYCTVPTIVAR
jgi:hypothetical protein